MSYDADWDDLEELEELEARGIVPTEDIHDFHERAAHVIRESGGRIHSLTFSYKWQQQYGENLQSFVRRQRLSVAAMLRQSGRFWVVDMQGMMNGEEESMDVSNQMQVYLLNEQQVQQTGRGQPLGDQLGMHGESDAIKAWRSKRRTATLSRQAEPVASRLAPEIVGLPDDNAVEWEGERVRPSYSYQQFSNGDDDDDEAAASSDETLPCLAVPKGLAGMERLGAVMRAIEPMLGARQAHGAWANKRCECASNAVVMLVKLGSLQEQGRGKQVRALDTQMRALGDVVQAGIAGLSVAEMAAALEVVVGRAGFDSLVLFAANRVLQSGKKFLGDSASCEPAAVASLIKTFVRAGQRDPLLYRQLAMACHQIPAERWSVDAMAETLGWLHKVNVRDNVLLRHFSTVLQQLPVKALSPEGVARISGALVEVGVHDEAVFRRLSMAVLQLPAHEFSAGAVSSILYSFVRAGLKDPAMLQRISEVVQQLDVTAMSADGVTRTLAALTMAKRRDPKLLEHMGKAIMHLGGDAFTPKQMGVVARGLAEAGVRNEEVLGHLAGAALRMEPWAFDVEAVALIVAAYAKVEVRDTALFGRLSTVLQQQEDGCFSLQSIGTIVKAYAHAEVQDDALLAKLAGVLQQMDGAVFGTPDAVQEVSVILDAFAHANMRQLALDLSATLTNHLRPHVGGLTAQAMANIVLRVQERDDAVRAALFHPSSAVVSRRGGAAATAKAMAKWRLRDQLEGRIGTQEADLSELIDNAPASWK